jgi:hypothetical protein
MKAKRLSDRHFGLAFAVIFGLVAGVVWFVNGSYQYWAVVVAAAFLLLALVHPVLLLPLNRLWMRLGHGIGLVTNTVLLGAFYFLIVTPFGWALRLLSKDPMQRRASREADSYFVPVRRHADPKTFPDMF